MLPGKQVVGLTQPKDGAKLATLAKQHGVQTRAIGGWTAIAKTSAALDAVANAKTHLVGQRHLFDGDEAAAERCARARVRERRRRRSSCSRRSRAPSRRSPCRTACTTGSRRARSTAPASMSARPSSSGAPPTLTSTSDGLKLEAFAKSDGLTAPGRPATSCSRRRRTPRRSSTRSRRARSRSSISRSPAGMFENMPKLPAALHEALRRQGRRAAVAARHAPRRRDRDLRPAVAADARGDARHAADRHRRRVDRARSAILAELPATSMLSGRQALPDDDRRPVRRLDDAGGARRLPRRRAPSSLPTRPSSPRRQQSGMGSRDHRLRLRECEGRAAAARPRAA